MDVLTIVGELTLGAGIRIIVVELVELVLVDGLVLLPDHLQIGLLVGGNGQSAVF